MHAIVPAALDFPIMPPPAASTCSGSSIGSFVACSSPPPHSSQQPRRQQHHSSMSSPAPALHCDTSPIDTLKCIPSSNNRTRAMRAPQCTASLGDCCFSRGLTTLRPPYHRRRSTWRAAHFFPSSLPLPKIYSFMCGVVCRSAGMHGCSARSLA